MRPTFMGFETARRGLMVNQKSLDIVANNTTNIGVTGYTRQRLDLVSLSVNMRHTRYNMNSTPFAGQGVAAYGVSQIRDTFLDKRFREEYAEVGEYNVRSSILGDLSSALDEVAPSTMTTAMKNFANVWEELIKKNNETTSAANAKAAATQIVSVFRQMSAKLDNIWSQQEYNTSLDINKMNSIMERIANLNDTIKQERFNCMDVGNTNYQPLELLDQRNVLLDQLSEYGNMTYREQEDGQVTVMLGGQEVVKGDKFEKLSMRTNTVDDRTKTVNLYWNTSGEDVSVTSGSLFGCIEMLNGRGAGGSGAPGETFAQGINYYRDKVDTFAKTFAESFNNCIEIAQPQLLPTDPIIGYTPPRYKQMFKFVSDEYNTAGTIEISDEWQADASYIFTDALEKLQEGNDDNNYAAKAKKLFESELDFGEFKGTITDYITFYSVTKLANDKAYSDSRLQAVSTISDDLLNKIQQISGVSMEEEGVDMLMYKKAYDAVSRVFTTLDEMLDKLINGTGVVGR